MQTNKKQFIKHAYCIVFCAIAVALALASQPSYRVLVHAYEPPTADLELVLHETMHETIVPNALNQFPLRIYNHGESDVTNPTIMVERNELQTLHGVIGVVPSMGYLDYTIGLMLPGSKISIAFTVYKDGLVEENTQNNTTVRDFLLTTVRIVGYTAQLMQNSLLFSIEIENKSLVLAENIVVAITSNDDTEAVFANLFVPILAANQTKIIQLSVDSFKITFNQLLNFEASIIVLMSDATINTLHQIDYAPENNRIDVLFSQNSLEQGQHLELFESSITLKVGQSYLLNYINFSGMQLSFESQNAAVVSVQSGTLRAHQVGQTQVVVSNGTLTEVLTVNVQANPYALVLNGEASISLLLGSSYAELGAIAYENENQTAVGRLRIFGQVNTNAIGLYQINYLYVVQNEVVVSQTRTVAIKPAQPTGIARFGRISGYIAIGSIAVLYNSQMQEVARCIAANNGYYYFNNLQNGNFYVVAQSNGVESESLLFTITDSNASSNIIDSSWLIVVGSILAVTAILLPTFLGRRRKKVL